jgi:ActR/RegA family two-component response regulator
MMHRFVSGSLKLSPDGNGLDIVAALKQHRPDVRAVIVTAYGNSPLR